MIRFACPTCQQTLKSHDGTARAKVACPKCGQKVRVPGVNKTTLGLPVPEDVPPEADATVSLTCRACRQHLSDADLMGDGWAKCPACAMMSKLNHDPPAASQQDAPRTPPLVRQPAPEAMPVVAWHYQQNGQMFGPESEQDMLTLILRGILLRTDMVWKAGMAAWAPAGRCFPFPRRGPAVVDYHPRIDSPETEGPSGKTCGILSCVFGGISFIPFCLLPFFFGLAGMVLGVVSLALSKHKALGVVGTVLSVLGMAASVFWVLFFISFANR
ncbi:MAG TPA: GYF domain-containing protein [Gemmataceae bacterium]|nr:GYF domain-containing protein [Gemmataceae bacterium]